jgi:hypothetical protein
MSQLTMCEVGERLEDRLPMPEPSVVSQVLEETGREATAITLPGHRRVLVGTADNLGKACVEAGRCFYHGQRMRKAQATVVAYFLYETGASGHPDEKKAIQLAYPSLAKYARQNGLVKPRNLRVEILNRPATEGCNDFQGYYSPVEKRAIVAELFQLSVELVKLCPNTAKERYGLTSHVTVVFRDIFSMWGIEA